MDISSVIKQQLRKSRLKDLDQKTYIAIAQFLMKEMEVKSIRDITEYSVQEYLTTKALKKLNRTQIDKVTYVSGLIIDWNNKRLSKKCEGIQVYCDYCGNITELVDNKEVGQSGGRKIYLCSKYPKCDSYVGVHKGDNWPRGRLANPKLRKLKQQAHIQLDRLQKTRELTRTQAYKLLQNEMGLKEHKSHIGVFNEDQCWQAISICNSYLNKYKS